MPKKQIFNKDKRIRNEQEVKYMNYIFAHFDTLSVDELMDECANIAKELKDDSAEEETQMAVIELFDQQLREDLKKYEDEVKSAATPEDKQKANQKLISTRYSTYCGMKAVLQNGVYLVDAGDAIKHNFHLVNPSDVSKSGVPQISFQRKKTGLSRAAHDFILVCEQLMTKHEQLKNDHDFDAQYEKLKMLTDKISANEDSVWAGGSDRSSEYVAEFISHVDNMDVCMQKLKIYDVNEDLAYINILYKLYLFRSDFKALFLAITHAADRGRIFAYALATKVYRVLAYGLGAAYEAGKAAAKYPARKAQRLWDQAIINAFRQEFGRFSEEARRLWKTPREKASVWEVGSHMKKPVNLVTGVAFRGAALMLYVPTKILVGGVNERYNFVNQVKLGVAGSYLGKWATRDEKGKPLFKIITDDETKKSNNTLLFVHTADYNPAGGVGASAMISKQNDGGHSVFLTSYTTDAGEKLLELLCKAVNDSDGNKLVIYTRAPEERVDVDLVSELIKGLKDEYKHINIMVNDKNVDVGKPRTRV